MTRPDRRHVEQVTQQVLHVARRTPDRLDGLLEVRRLLQCRDSRVKEIGAHRYHREMVAEVVRYDRQDPFTDLNRVLRFSIESRVLDCRGRTIGQVLGHQEIGLGVSAARFRREERNGAQRLFP